MNSQFFSLLLRDTALLLRPATVTIIPESKSALSSADLEAHPSANALRVFSDLAEFVTESPTPDRASEGTAPSAQPKSRPKPNHVVHKLTFYAAYLLGTPAPMLRVLADEVTMRANALEKEAKQAAQAGSQSINRVGQQPSQGARIEELT